MKITEKWLAENRACSDAKAYLRVRNWIGIDAIILLKKLKKWNLDYCIWGIGSCTDIPTLMQAIKIIDINARDNVGLTPLHWACYNGHIETAKTLLDHGAKVNVKNDCGQTSLHFASRYGYTETAKILLDHGAKVNVKNNCGDTPLHSACCNGHAEVAKILLEHGADVNAENIYGETPLYYTDMFRHTEVIKLLKEHGARI